MILVESEHFINKFFKFDENTEITRYVKYFCKILNFRSEAEKLQWQGFKSIGAQKVPRGSVYDICIHYQCVR